MIFLPKIIKYKFENILIIKATVEGIEGIKTRTIKCFCITNLETIHNFVSLLSPNPIKTTTKNFNTFFMINLKIFLKIRKKN